MVTNLSQAVTQTNYRARDGFKGRAGIACSWTRLHNGMCKYGAHMRLARDFTGWYSRLKTKDVGSISRYRR